MSKAFRIGIDCRMYNESGVGRYIRNLLFNLQKLDKNNQYFIFLLKDTYDTQEYHNNFQKVLTNFRWYGVSEQILFPKILKQFNLDLMHFPHFNMPIFYSDKFVVTIHDLIHQHFRMKRVTTLDPLTYKIKQLAYNAVFKTAVSQSVMILTPSNYVKKLLIKEWVVKDNKIVVTHEGVDDKILTLNEKISNEMIKKILNKFNIKRPYIFYIGNAHPHKNVEGLIKTFLNLRKKFQYLSLVLSGTDHYFWQKIKREFQDKDIIYTGLVTDEELVALYKGAQCFVMPSFEEGFGIPLLEAMACSCPVVCSNAASLPEIGGDAAFYFDPTKSDDMLTKIIQALNSEKVRKELIEKGQKRYRLFSWENLAKQTLEGYLKCV